MQDLEAEWHRLEELSAETDALAEQESWWSLLNENSCTYGFACKDAPKAHLTTQVHLALVTKVSHAAEHHDQCMVYS